MLPSGKSISARLFQCMSSPEEYLIRFGRIHDKLCNLRCRPVKSRNGTSFPSPTTNSVKRSKSSRFPSIRVFDIS